MSARRGTYGYARLADATPTRAAVNRLVAGSNPARGAIAKFVRCFLMIFFAFCQTLRRV